MTEIVELGSTEQSFNKTPDHRSVQKHSNYFEIYDQYLRKFRNIRPVIVEIGVQHGGSLLIWNDFIAPWPCLRIGNRLVGKMSRRWASW